MTEKRYRKKKRSPRYTLEKTELIGLEAIQDIIELVLWTLYIIGERIVSLLLVADPESGKTELMKKYRENLGIHVRRRFTAYGIIRDLIDKKIPLLFKRPRILGYFLIYDFADIITTYKKNTVEGIIRFFNAFTQDGLSPESEYWVSGNELESYKNLKGGLIAALTTFGFFTKTRKVREILYKGGWFGRNIVVTYSISQQMSSKISKSIVRGEYRTDKKFKKLISLKFPKKRLQVYLPERYSKEIRILASEIAGEYSENLKPHKLKGFRLQKSLIALAKASALRDGRKVVYQRDVDRITYLSQWLNLRMNPLKPDYPFR